MMLYFKKNKRLDRVPLSRNRVQVEKGLFLMMLFEFLKTYFFKFPF